MVAARPDKALPALNGRREGGSGPPSDSTEGVMGLRVGGGKGEGIGRACID